MMGTKALIAAPYNRSVVTSPKVAEIGRGRMDDGKLLSKEEREEFMSMFPQLIRDLTEIPEYRDMDDTNRWLARVMHYNVPHGKRNRGLATALAYRYLAKELTDENVKLSYVLGWCVEILQAYFLVADDIMDESQTRRGRPCWYKVDDLGDNAFNDAILLESNLYMLLKKYFRNKDYYADLVDVMHDVNHKTIYGQSLDTRTGMEKKLETYTMDRYAAIVKYKTCFYSFYLPVRLGMAMVGMNDPDVLQQVRTVTLEMGHFFQVQDDYLDCFGDPAVTGKIGTDIQDSKCSWLFVVASQKCTPEQKKYLWENYGQNDPEKIARVKKLYIELEMPQTFSLYEEQTYNLICTHIRQMSEKLPKQLFYDMVNKIYKRSV
ncbi:farnesyl pyrophosphate synthase isoform X2 [Folsomia candida]|uniref:farnesyl pyrophosphate synthase isoform X2 n=1 Tax=Folsomia candida TaxID=158441 RepID=UPI000B9087A3|nr:farnesyl pyrophosphate synthase isoform X2 [Folsomia candida]